MANAVSSVPPTTSLTKPQIRSLIADVTRRSAEFFEAQVLGLLRLYEADAHGRLDYSSWEDFA